MSFVLTENSRVTCANQGTVQLVAGQSKLKVNGSNVLVEGDLTGAAIGGCTTVTDPNSGAKICSSVSSVVNGVANKLTINGKGVLLENIQGTTDGTVGAVVQFWSVQNAGQAKLKAI